MSRSQLLPRAVFFLALLGGARLVMAQATTNPNTVAKPAVAVERVKPDLDAWWNSAVFYQVFVRSFADSTSGPLANDGVGDLRGLIERLDYLNDGKGGKASLGINALWLMPIMQSPSYHGYDISDYKKVNDAYGTNEDYKTMLAECNKRGIRVILDLVPNHSSWENPWFKEAVDPQSPKHDWYVWSEKDPGWKGPWNQDVWHPWPATGANRGSAGYYYGIFWKGMPDLNFRNQGATGAMNDVVKFWLDMGTAGYRIDAIRHLIEEGQQQESTAATHEWIRKFRASYKAVKPDAFTVGEVWATTEQVVPYIGNELDSAFEFHTAYATIDALNEGKRDKLDAQWKDNLASYPFGQFSTFLSNHDQDRVMSRFGGGKLDTAKTPADSWDKARVAATLLLTSPGIPFIYYGEEIGMVGVKPDEDIRTPMQWTAGRNAGFTDAEKPWRPANADAALKNVEAQAKDPASLLAHYKKVIRLRGRYKALRTGEMTILETADPAVWAFLRKDGDETIAILANLSAKPVSAYGLRLPPELTDRKPVTDLLGRKGLPKTRSGGYKPGETLRPHEVMVLRIGV